MTEFNTSPQNEFDPVNNEEDRRALEVASEDLRNLLVEKGIDPNDAMLWGFNSQFPQAAAEHMVDDEHRLLHVGTIEDTLPSSFRGPEDQEQQQEAWMVNPFKYAIEGGSLEVFSREKLMALPHEVDEDGYGTMVVTATDSEMHQAKVLRSAIDIVRNPQTLRMSESDYHLLWNARPEDAEVAFGVKPDTGIIRIEVEAADGSTSIVYMDTVEHDFGVKVSNVLEIGRPVELARGEIEEVGPSEDDSKEVEADETSLLEIKGQLSAELDKVRDIVATLDSLLETDAVITQRFNNLFNQWNSIKYSFSGGDSKAFFQEIYALQSDITSMADTTSPARVATGEIAGQLEVIRSAIVAAEQEQDSDIVRISRNVDEFSADLYSNLKGAISRLDEGISGQLSLVITYIDNMAHDTYGREAYISSIDHAMMEMDAYFREGSSARGYLLRAQSAAEELRGLRNQLDSVQ